MRAAPRLFALAVLLAVLAFAHECAAHAIGLSSGEYAARGPSLSVKLSFARSEIAALVPALDADRDGHVTASEVSRAHAMLEEKVLGELSVRAGGEACAPALLDAALTEEDGLFVEGRYDCARGESGFEVQAAILDRLSNGHRHVARATSGEAVHDEVLYRGHASLSVPPAAAEAAQAGPSSRPTRGAFGFFRMGIEHILTGYDHLVFLLGLVLVPSRARTLLGVVTAFTVAHSITLALAALGVWAPSPSVVEPAIALSIVYVGVENFFVEDARKRWRITFPFGLIHGFGFAGALREIALPRPDLPLALATFNLGVEAGQVAVIAAVLPLVLALQRRAWFERRGVRLVSGAVAVAGAVWFVLRVASGG